MKKLLTLLTLFLVACQTAPKTTDSEITVDTIIMESDFSPPTEPELGWGNDGPYEQRLMSARSDDGMTWERTNKVITEQGNTPDIVLNDEGQIMLYYTGGNIDDEDVAIAVAISDYGNEWLYKKLVIEGQPKVSTGGDPDIVRLQDGTYRLYYTAHLQGDEQPGILYAESENGINFTYKGQAFYNADYAVMDSNTFYIDGQWVMITLDGNPKAPGLLYAVSKDGKLFEMDSTRSLDGTMNAFLSNDLVHEDGSLEMFGFNLQEGVKSYTTETGLDWTLSGQHLSLNTSGGLEAYYLKDPAVIQLSDGTYFMVYVTRFPDDSLSSTVTPTPEGTLLETDVVCGDDACLDCSKQLYSDGSVVDLGTELVCNTALWDSLAPSRGRYAYFEDTRLMLFDYATQSSQELMSLLDTVEGASVFWAPSGDRLAVVAMNWDYPDLTKVFVLDLDSQGRLLDKNTYLIKVRYSCHDAGCNVQDGSFWFEDEKTLRYQTFEGDPYDEENVTWERYQL